MELRQIDINSLVPHPDNDRLFPAGTETIDELAESIKEYGILQPLLVREIGSQYLILAGHRRYTAAKMIGLKDIPCVVDNEIDEHIALVESNVRTRELTPMQKAAAIRYLKEKIGIKQGTGPKNIGNDFRSLEEIFGCTDRMLRIYDSLNDLIPELQELVERKKLSISVAAKLAQQDKEVQKLFWNVLGEDVCNLKQSEVQGTGLLELGAKIIESLNRQINEMQDELNKYRQKGRDASKIEEEIKSLEAKKKQLYRDIVNYNSMLNDMKQKYNEEHEKKKFVEMVERIANEANSLKLRIENIKISDNTATHLLRYAKVIKEFGEAVESIALNELQLKVNN